LGTLSHFN